MDSKDSRHKEKKEEENFQDPSREFRRLFAELWGTFLLVLVAAGGAMVAEHSGKITEAMKVVAPGLMVMAIIYFMGAVSGAHLNPSVTIAFALRRHFPWKRVPAYLLAQVIGAIAAAAFLKLLLGTVGDLGATVPEPGLENWKAVLIEIVLTTGLINTILGTASGPRNVGNNGAIAVGGYIALAGLWSAPLTGASMNPARSLGPDIVRGDMHTTWIYLLATFSGAVLAVTFEWILKGKPSEHATQEAQGSGW
jgi:aquaporin Z